MSKLLVALFSLFLTSLGTQAQSKNNSTLNKWGWGLNPILVKDSILSVQGWELSEAKEVASDHRGDYQMLFWNESKEVTLGYLFRNRHLANIDFVVKAGNSFELELTSGLVQTRPMEWVDAANNTRIKRQYNGDHVLYKLTPNSVVMLPGPMYGWLKKLTKSQMTSYMLSKHSWFVNNDLLGEQGKLNFLSQDQSISVGYKYDGDVMEGFLVVFWDASPSKTKEYFREVQLLDREWYKDKEYEFDVSRISNDGRVTVYVRPLNRK